jgi:hypothetical protein
VGKPNLTKLGRVTIYFSFIMSNFNYCPIVWHFCGETNTRKIEKIQERVLRILSFKVFEPMAIAWNLYGFAFIWLWKNQWIKFKLSFSKISTTLFNSVSEYDNALSST